MNGDKRELRRRIREARARIRDDERAAADAAIARRGSDLMSRVRARVIACYLSAPDEPPTRGLVDAAASRGIRVLLPISGPGGILEWAEDTGDERLTPFGVPETTGQPLGPDTIRDADLIFAPAAAVDPEGYRMGWGMGYYDRALARVDSRRPVYAVLYDADVVARVPREPHDMPVSGVVTPTRTLSFDR